MLKVVKRKVTGELKIHFNALKVEIIVIKKCIHIYINYKTINIHIRRKFFRNWVKYTFKSTDSSVAINKAKIDQSLANIILPNVKKMINERDKIVDCKWGYFIIATAILLGILAWIVLI